ncbi:MAG: hypothetical protein Q8N18_25935 [Opitutaceae bacterium]|nr:hypothetical protein [Opitutaceae bacterium]
MRPLPKVKALSTRVPLRKAAMSAAALSRRPFPAWIVADDGGVSFSARTAISPRVRDALVLRTVAKKKSASPRHPDVHGHR